ncbi:CDC11 [Hepatospora eriocheir]|uniref:CDC11 n=1 Tax=Hepatospora eriocheir TaxID=1081669 RepID=A0A1X0QLG9_9MICR|nr:CDC11 [Hepatospora eriocheir]ORE00610.1 CDC11 [Hepatospora eriocheir]
MVVGCKKSGKSSFLDTLVGKTITKNENILDINIYKLNLDCDDKSYKKVTLIDTPGFDTENDIEIQEVIIDFIKAQYNCALEEESKIRRDVNFEDPKVHCLVYLIPSTSDGLKQKEIMFLKKVSKLVNIIPVISKADGLTSNETLRLKKYILDQLYYHKIEIFNLDTPDSVNQSDLELNVNSDLPLTFVSDLFKEKLSTNFTKGQDFNFQSEFQVLKDILLNIHIETLIETTNTTLYENYRTEMLENKLKK